MLNKEPSPDKQKVLIVGGGVAALETMLALRHLANGRLEIELLAPSGKFEYRPYAVVEPFDSEVAKTLDLGALVHQQGATHHVGSLVRVMSDKSKVETGDGEEISFDYLVLAHGAKPVETLDGALTFSGFASVGEFRVLLKRLEVGAVADLVFVMPGGTVWPLPLYELALQTSQFLQAHNILGVNLQLVTTESAPLAIFDGRASDAVAELLKRNGMQLTSGSYATSFNENTLKLLPEKTLRADAVVTLPQLIGVAPEGLPCDSEGFLSTDRHGHVDGFERIFAAGDCTDFPLKQGGLAAQQSDAVAESIAAAAGATIEPSPFKPVLRGVLLTGEQSRYMRAGISGGAGEGSVSASRPLWWPPSKIAGRYLAPYLASCAGLGLPPTPPGQGVPIEVFLADRLGMTKANADLVPSK